MASSSLPALPCDKIICLGKSGFFFCRSKKEEKKKGKKKLAFPSVLTE